MPQFAYRALNQNGRQVRGRITADNDIDLLQQLRSIGLELVDARPVGERRLRLPLGGAIKTRDLVQLCLHLEQLQAAGVSMLEGLADVRDATEQPRLREILADIYKEVSEGMPLSRAFGRHPKVFGTVFTAVIASGEESGNLTESFHQLVKHLKWTDAVNSKIRKALRYPSFILLILVGMFFFMMGFVVPQVVAFLKSQGQELPFLTVSLIATSDFVQVWWPVLLAVPFGLISLIKLAARASPAAAYRLDALLLALPVAGPMLRKISLSRFAHFFAIMFQSGVPILRCLETARQVVANRVLSEAVGLVHGAVQQGETLSGAMRRSGQFPSLVLRMIRIGEDSGNLSGTLENVTSFYDRDVDEAVDGLVGMMEPALTVVAGILMAWIIAGVMGPIYDSFDKLGM